MLSVKLPVSSGLLVVKFGGVKSYTPFDCLGDPALKYLIGHLSRSVCGPTVTP